jgi:hypothetical protein
MRFAAFCILFLFAGIFAGHAQQDTSVQTTPVIRAPQQGGVQVLDSVIMATANRQKFL